ncbi:MAG: hypothetical protein K1X67_24120 [Fimbriimonadaceae bacterium]|nr:hypothetical protein [Fimbriimonadaceae bacterium]
MGACFCRCMYVVGLTALVASVRADLAVVPSHPGLAEWRDAGPGANTQGNGTITSGSTVTGNLHVLRVEIQVLFSGLPEGYEVYVGTQSHGLDEFHDAIHSVAIPAHSTLGTSGGGFYMKAALIGTPTERTPFIFHINNPLSAVETSLTVPVFFAVKNTSTNVWAYAKQNYSIVRLNCNDAAIDTRLTFGDPNVAGEVVPDPNASAGYVKFGPWQYKGGLFVGNMPWLASQDRSGKSRIQFYYDDGSTPTVRTLTVFHRNSGYDRGTCPTLGAFLPRSNDSNLFSGQSLSQRESGLSWGNRWDINPRPVAETATNEWDEEAISTVSTYLNDDFANFPLQKYQENGTLIAGAGTYSAGRVCLAVAEESTMTGSSPLGWRYFTSREFEDIFTEGIYTDCRPRVWGLTPGTLSDFVTP